MERTALAWKPKKQQITVRDVIPMVYRPLQNQPEDGRVIIHSLEGAVVPLNTPLSEKILEIPLFVSFRSAPDHAPIPVEFSTEIVKAWRRGDYN